MGIRERLVANHASGQLAAVLLAEQLAAVEWIQVSRVASVIVLDNKMAGQSNARDTPDGTTRNLDVNERERYGNAGALIKHPVEAAIFWVVVVGLIASKPDVVKQVCVRARDELLTVHVFGLFGELGAHFVQSLKIRLNHQGWKLDCRQLESSHVEGCVTTTRQG